jgi:spectinomycin phosphotransferase
VRSPPAGLSTDTVVQTLRDGWGLDVDDAEYAPLGAGSYHWEVGARDGVRAFVTVDDLGQKAWLGDTRDEAFAGLQSAFDTAVALRKSGLEFVVAPIPTRSGESLRRLDPRYTVALFPFRHGEAGAFGRYEDDGERRAVVAMLGELHRTPAAAREAGLALPGRRHLETALRELDVAWTGGPLSEPAREAVRNAATELADLLALADRLRTEAESRGVASVVTHGEPHRANVLRTGEGLALVDWDTVALAPPERDLWFVVDNGADAADLGTQVNEVALDYFRLTWDLKDVAEYLNVLRGPHSENDDTVREYEALTRCATIREEWAALLA